MQPTNRPYVYQCVYIVHHPIWGFASELDAGLISAAAYVDCCSVTLFSWWPSKVSGCWWWCGWSILAFIFCILILCSPSSCSCLHVISYLIDFHFFGEIKSRFIPRVIGDGKPHVYIMYLELKDEGGSNLFYDHTKDFCVEEDKSRKST